MTAVCEITVCLFYFYPHVPIKARINRLVLDGKLDWMGHNDEYEFTCDVHINIHHVLNVHTVTFRDNKLFVFEQDILIPPNATQA